MPGPVVVRSQGCQGHPGKAVSVFTDLVMGTDKLHGEERVWGKAVSSDWDVKDLHFQRAIQTVMPSAQLGTETGAERGRVSWMPGPKPSLKPAVC